MTLVDAKTWHAHDTIAAAREFCLRHGEQPTDVTAIEDDVIDTPLLRFTIKLTDEDGNNYLGCGHHSGQLLTGCDSASGKHDCYIATTTREHALIGALPDWWSDVA